MSQKSSKKSRSLIMQSSKPYKLTLALFMVVVVAATGLYLRNKYVSRAAGCVGWCPVFQLYNGSIGTHFYTFDDEVPTASAAGWGSEGILNNGGHWMYASHNTGQPSGTVPIYRTYNPSTGQRFLGRNSVDVAWAVSQGFQNEGLAFYAFDHPVPGSTPIWDIINDGVHDEMYVADATYKASLNNGGYVDRGVWFYLYQDQPSGPSTSISANPNPVSYNGAATLSWNASNNYGDTSCSGSGGNFGGAKGLSGSQSTGGLTGAVGYIISCSSPVGSSSSSVTVNVNQPASPSVSLTVDGSTSTSVTTNSNVTLAWSTSNATSCTASNAWGGAKSANSSSEQINVGGSAGTKIYVMTCANAAGATSNSSASVSVSAPASPPPANPPPVAPPPGPSPTPPPATPPPPPAAPLPIVTLGANPNSIIRGNASTLTWHVANATSCNGAGGTLAGYVNPADGSKSTGILTASTSYSLSCTNADGVAASANASVTVGSQPAPPPPDCFWYRR